MAMIEVLDSIMCERQNQDRRWGEQNHLPVEWIAIIGEEFGEAAQQAVKANYSLETQREVYHRALLREELLQLAAVTVAAIESHDREDARRRRLRQASCEDTIAGDDGNPTTTERTSTDG